MTGPAALVSTSRIYDRHPEAPALLRGPRRMNGPRRGGALPLVAAFGPSPFEARAIARQDARERAYGARAPQGDGESNSSRRPLEHFPDAAPPRAGAISDRPMSPHSRPRPGWLADCSTARRC